ncbi:DNA-dependent DNA polymerase [Bdellovibrio svalbardensis]|uniref:DNA-dependent DNA polymerase n=1 Tax=Bdellovibrio svalbardensis TaxID=2972972 RepID=A0ABT6DM69_9BACT|nr:DNA-dependent DNA polymerase [Bdellovibrio svalbardensis]MDG0817973.1 DNA-dependent DNA polymerase [Bdellovibrio svalbardensis]
MHKDNLLNIITTQLKETSNMREKTPDFIRKIVNLYTLQLMNLGTIPLEFMDEVMADIEEEAIEIFRKKTYGFLTLEEYRRHSFRQKDDN